MNDYEIQRIAAAMNTARPDWPLKQLLTLLADPRLANRPRRDVFVAMAWVASDVGTGNPYRVLESGPWWRAAMVETPQATVRHPPKREQECRVHPGEYADHCRVCNAPKAYDDPNPVPSLPGQADPNRWATEARQRIRDAKGPAA